MSTGFIGTYVMSWSQAELDGQKTPQLSALRVGATWSWRGEPVRVDGPGNVLQLDRGAGERELRRRAARAVRRFVGAALEPGQFDTNPNCEDLDMNDPVVDGGFVVTDGSSSYTASLIALPGAPPLVMFVDELPVPGRDYWVVQASKVDAVLAAGPKGDGMICFTPGTRIATAFGPVAVQDLRVGDKVLTKDNGPQPIVWAGVQRISGARLYAMPDLRPVRIRAGAFGIKQPHQALLVSPAHRMLVSGRSALALFNTPEVLVTARDMIDGSRVVLDTRIKEVTYVHLLLENHEVIWANGVETESFHPANASMASLASADRARLMSDMPLVGRDPMLYGDFVRRNLTKSEAAIMRHDVA